MKRKSALSVFLVVSAILIKIQNIPHRGEVVYPRNVTFAWFYFMCTKEHIMIYNLNLPRLHYALC